MAANLANHGPIKWVQSTNQKGPFTMARPERAAQNYKAGVFVQPYSHNNGLFAQGWDGTTFAGAIWGLALCNGSNLATDGSGAPVGYGPVTGTKAQSTYGSVTNQSGAVNIPIGAPATDGRTLFLAADDVNIFEAVYDNSGGSTASSYTPTASLEGTTLGLAYDANGYLFLDAALTGNSAVALIVGQNPNYGFGQVNGLLRFKILPAARFDY